MRAVFGAGGEGSAALRTRLRGVRGLRIGIVSLTHTACASLVAYQGPRIDANPAGLVIKVYTESRLKNAP
jgi:hypothetical protein